MPDAVTQAEAQVLEWGVLGQDRYWLRLPDGKLLQTDGLVLAALRLLAEGVPPAGVAERAGVAFEDVVELMALLRQHGGLPEGRACPLVERREEDGRLGWGAGALAVAVVAAALVQIAYVLQRPLFFPVGLGRQWLLAGLFLLAIALHELGHFLAARRYLHTRLELSWLGPWPVLSLPVNEAWTLPRRRRLLIDGAGLLADVIAGGAVAVAALLWPAAGEWTGGFLVLHWVRMLMAANPFIPGDGYWLLVDLLNTPNLRERARQHLRQRRPDGYAAYAVMSACWQVLLWVSWGFCAWLLVAIGRQVWLSGGVRWAFLAQPAVVGMVVSGVMLVGQGVRLMMTGQKTRRGVVA